MLKKVIAAAPAAILAFNLLTSHASAAQPLIELKVGSKSYEGRVVDKGRGWTVMYDRSGQMHNVDLSRVTKFRKLKSEFEPHTFRTIRTGLLKEFGKEYEVGTSRHYLVCAPHGRARDYADVFEAAWRRFHMYFSVRGFRMDDPEFPLVAVVFKDQKSFLAHAKKERANIGGGILGYYWSTHNRVLMYETAKSQRSTASLHGLSATDMERLVAMQERTSRGRNVVGTLSASEAADADPRVAADWAGIQLDELATSLGVDADLKETMIHEATHQLGYNLGLHNRVGRNARWIVEGLATVFETPGMENSRGGRSSKRANQGWLFGFKKFVKNGRPKYYLEDYIRSDDVFSKDMSNAYAQAWALSFWLIETRPRKFGQFLKAMGSDDVSRKLDGDRRVEVFKEAFGSNLKMLDVEMLRFYDRMK